MNNHGPIHLSPEVGDALAHGKPIVAVESTVLTHAFDSTTARRVAQEIDAGIRAGGAVPALLAVWEGRIRVGVDDAFRDDFIERGARVRKLATRDLATAVVDRAAGALTVSASLAICGRVDIQTLSTGAIGGVHRGYVHSHDISADLTQLSHTPAIVACAGVKSILDVPATLEHLETLGVPVIGYQTSTLPLFYQRDGGPRLSTRADSVEHVAEIARTHWSLGRDSSVIIARPPTIEIDVLSLIEEGLARAEQDEISGPDVTPYLLDHLDTATNGLTIEPHAQLIVDNARLAAQAALALSQTP